MFGVIRRAALERTCRLANFAGGDRAMLAELAPLGRFRDVLERLFLKRFRADVSKGVERLSEHRREVLLTHVRQLWALDAAPGGKVIGAMSKSIYVLVVSVHCLKVAAQSVVRKEAWNANQGAVSRRQTGPPM
jgi:hypothetical protein